MNLTRNNNTIKFPQPKIFYLSSFISSLYNGIIGSLFVVYLLAINFNPAQIGITLAAQRISIIVFEIPTGIFADRYGRKKSVLISFFLFSILFLIWFFAKNFYLLILISMMGGLAYTFQSGARDSLLIDNLGLQNDDKKRDKIFAHFSTFGLAGSIFGGIIAAGLAFYWLKSIWLAASFFNLFLLFLFLFFIHENFKPTIIKADKFRNFFKTAKNNFKLIIQDKIIILFMVVNAVFVFLTAIYGLIYPILFKQSIHIPNYYFGLLGTLSAVMGIIGIFFAQRLTRRKNYFFTLGCLSLMLGVFFLLFGFKSAFWWSVIIFSLIELVINGWYPIYQSLFNKFIPDQNRAGILSTNSTFSLLFIALGELITGLALNFIKPNNVLMLATPIFLVLIILIIKLHKEKKPETK